jgi:hypothetical protein
MRGSGVGHARHWVVEGMHDSAANGPAAHDPPASRTASEDADRALADQRAAHQPDDVEVDDEGVGAIVNNTGLDGDAATG